MKSCPKRRGPEPTQAVSRPSKRFPVADGLASPSEELPASTSTPRRVPLSTTAVHERPSAQLTQAVTQLKRSAMIHFFDTLGRDQAINVIDNRGSQSTDGIWLRLDAEGSDKVPGSLWEEQRLQLAGTIQYRCHIRFVLRHVLYYSAYWDTQYICYKSINYYASWLVKLMSDRTFGLRLR